MKWLSRVLLFVTPGTVAYQASPSMGFSRQEYGSGLPFPSQEIFPTQGLNVGLPYCRQTLYHLSHQERRKVVYKGQQFLIRNDVVYKKVAHFPRAKIKELKTSNPVSSIIILQKLLGIKKGILK